ncbi:acyl-CoA N-acyltransferase [Irpex lacteus]|nr:acyl-CoA N-acyltransferase [Irpex lacteus]
MKSTDGVPAIRRLRLIDIPKATRMHEAAMQHDPVMHYFRDTSDAKAEHWQKKWRLDIAIVLYKSVRRGQTWVIGDSLATLTYELPGETEDAIDRLISRLMKLFSRWITPRILSEQQRRRGAEWGAKFKKTVEEVLGDRKESMWYLAEVATHPDHQGHGYGSALIRQFTDQADAHGCASWLMSSNVNNTGFYNSLGFVTEADILMGDDDPDWHTKPVVIKLMVREPSEKRPLSA